MHASRQVPSSKLSDVCTSLSDLTAMCSIQPVERGRAVFLHEVESRLLLESTCICSDAARFTTLMLQAAAVACNARSAARAVGVGPALVIADAALFQRPGLVYLWGQGVHSKEAFLTKPAVSAGTCCLLPAVQSLG